MSYQLRSRTRAAAGGSSPIDHTEDADKSTPTAVQATEKPHANEFGGPLLVFPILFVLPAVVVFLYAACNHEYCVSYKHFDLEKIIDKEYLLSQLDVDSLVMAAYIFSGWFVFQILLERFLPAKIAQGVSTPSMTSRTKSLSYRINGHLAFWVTLLIMGHAFPKFTKGKLSGLGAFPLAMLYDLYLPLVVVTVAFCWILSVVLYALSFRNPSPILSVPGNTGNPIVDFFMGRELNPRFFGSTFDIKCFCELRPGLIGWVVLNLGMLMHQYETLGYVSGSMVLVNLFQGLYVWDALYNEQSVLTTMDITTDGFGYMLVFGDLAWVPFTYSLQARYLADHPDSGLPVWALAAIAALNMAGYAIFRLSNSEKDAFRRDPKAKEVAHLKTMTTGTGRKLLISGWWGMARKINYTGDWLMGLSWCLLCGFKTPITLFYCIYFFILLVHRAIRDDASCSSKYGKDWIEYKKKVKYVFIPGLV